VENELLEEPLELLAPLAVPPELVVPALVVAAAADVLVLEAVPELEASLFATKLVSD
jgi:hypothetical protein